jgi:hypothetical protein
MSATRQKQRPGSLRASSDGRDGAFRVTRGTITGSVLLVLLSFLFPVPAYAVQPGSVRAFINNVPGNASFSVGANAVGWARGNIDVSVDVFISNSSTGPWEKIFSLDNSCTNSTSCSTASGGYGASGGSCSSGAWYKAVGRAWGRGGAAENNPDKVKKYIYGTLPAVAGSETTVTTFQITPQCKIIYTQI